MRLSVADVRVNENPAERLQDMRPQGHALINVVSALQ